MNTGSCDQKDVTGKQQRRLAAESDGLEPLVGNGFVIGYVEDINGEDAELVAFEPTRGELKTLANHYLSRYFAVQEIFAMGQSGWKDGPILYHHFDGYPDYMLPTLSQLLGKAARRLKKMGRSTHSEELAAILVAESMAADSIPPFQPCRCRHDDIEYSYHVYVYGNDIEIQAEHRDDGIVEMVAIGTEVAV